MQCFQKDPNLRVSAKKLLKHPWIAGCRRSDAPISKKPAGFDQAVEEVKQWNKALKYSEPSLRASSGSDGVGGAQAPRVPPHGQPVSRFGPAAAADPQRSSFATPSAKRPLTASSAAKPKPNAGMFRSPEVADDDNWDKDFATAISPSALHLPHLKPQDNFGGKLSADRLKLFASIDETSARDNWDEHFEGDLQSVKSPESSSRTFVEQDSQEQTIRPIPRRSSKSVEASKAPHGHKKSRSKQSSSNVPLLKKVPSKLSLSSKFELPLRRENIYREQSTEDFSELFQESDSLFSRKMSRATKVSLPANGIQARTTRFARILMLFPTELSATANATGRPQARTCQWSGYALARG